MNKLELNQVQGANKKFDINHTVGWIGKSYKKIQIISLFICHVYVSIKFEIVSQKLKKKYKINCKQLNKPNFKDFLTTVILAEHC